ncbi:MAG: DUF4406 domain-containing protein [Bacteroidales bacterium]|nr:DUF4406 domain-containing protein [Bacteroidales bacterium]
MTTPEGPIYSIYLSGKITGDPDYREKFAIVAKVLRVKFPGKTVFNPAHEYLEIAEKLDKSGASDEEAHDILVDMCIRTLKECDAIALMPDWTDSRGAIAEVDAAIREGLKFIFVEKDWLP